MKYANCYERYADLTPEHVAAMREWCLDCMSGNYDFEEDEINEASDNEIVMWVARQYDGGVRGFITDGR